MVTSDNDNFVNVDRDGENGKQWKYGKEIWCNLEGRYTHIVADLSGLRGSYEMSLCHLGIMGTEYIRSTPLPASLDISASSSTILDVP
jgi:hypothetical protein